MTTPHIQALVEAAIEPACRARCRSEGTAQCAAWCLEFFASSTTDGKCPHAIDVWRRHLEPALVAAFEAAEIKLSCEAFEEHAWLIEQQIGGVPHYFGKVEEADLDFTPDHNAAVRYARREDAQLVINYYGWTEVIAVEHAWVGPRK